MHGELLSMFTGSYILSIGSMQTLSFICMLLRNKTVPRLMFPLFDIQPSVDPNTLSEHSFNNFFNINVFSWWSVSVTIKHEFYIFDHIYSFFQLCLVNQKCVNKLVHMNINTLVIHRILLQSGTDHNK